MNNHFETIRYGFKTKCLENISLTVLSNLWLVNIKIIYEEAK